MLKILLLSVTFMQSILANNLWNKQVYYKGNITDLLEKSQIASKINLNKLKNKPNLYALGIGSYLKGEIQIMNSDVKNTYVKNNTIIHSKTYDTNATFLIYSQVPSWEKFKIPYNIYTKKQFEDWLETTADEYGLDTYEPFPFLLEGTLKANSYRILDAQVDEKIKTGEIITCACAIDSKENKDKIKISTIYETLLHTKIKGLGFFYYKRGIITEQTSFINLHFITEDNKIAGYSRKMMLGNDMVLKLPKIR